MSYVLDALKKADAERERGAVPGLHAQPMQTLLGVAPSASRVPGWVWGLLGGLVVLALTLAWQLTRPRPQADEPTSALQRAQKPEQRSAAESAPVVQRVEPPLVRKELEPPAELVRRPARVDEHPSRTGSPAEKAPAAGNEAPPRAAVPQRATNGTPATAAEGRIPPLSELPPELQRQIPPLTIGGSVYSDNPATRFLIINGQVFHEKDALAPDLTLEQIHLKLAVFRFKDQRFRLSY